MFKKYTLKLTFIALSAFFSQQTLAHELKLAQPHFLGEIVLPTGLQIDGQEFGGISGLDYNPQTDTYLAISDDRSQKAPARFYNLQLALSNQGITALEITKTQHLKNLAGQNFAEKTTDPEGIRYHSASNTIIWSTERDANGLPQIYQADLDGKALKAYKLPEYYNPIKDQKIGIYNNQGFEGLTLSIDGTKIIYATESALQQDGGKASLNAGSYARIGMLDLATGELLGEYAYLTDPITIQATQEPFWNDNGISEILMLDESHLIVVERAFGLGAGNHIRLYIVELTADLSVLGQDKLTDKSKNLQKQLWFEIREGSFGGINVDNIEALTFGPKLDDKNTIILASDNNFNSDGQFTQFLAFSF